MTISKHVVTAELNVGLGHTLDVMDAKLTLDDAWSPYSQATLTIHTPDETVLELLDPRDNPRVVVTVTKEFGDWNPSGAFVDQSRVFNLLLRARDVDHVTGTTDITLASDEALLQDFALVATASERTYGVSVKDAVQYALDKIGATLEAGAADADLESKPLDPVLTNLIPNPSSETNVTGWFGDAYRTMSRQLHSSFGGGIAAEANEGSYFARCTFGGYGGGLSDSGLYYSAGFAVVAGQTYTVTAWVRSSIAQRITPAAQVITGSGSNPVGTGVVVAAGVWTKITHTFVAPGTATKMGPFFYNTAGTGSVGWPAGALFDVDELMAVNGSTPVDYFDGATPDTGLLDFAWTGAAHASTSTCTNLPNTDALIWQPGITGWDWLEPLLQATGLRLYCDEARKWWLETSGTPRAGSINVSAQVNATQATDQISRTADTWYDSVVIAYTKNLDAEGKAITLYDAAGGPGTKTLKLEYDRPFPGAGAATAILNRAQGRGRVLKLESISNYLATPGMALVATLPDSPIQTGIISSAEWSFPDDRMTIGSRGLTDTPSTAWVLVPDGVAWVDKPDGMAWGDYTA